MIVESAREDDLEALLYLYRELSSHDERPADPAPIWAKLLACEQTQVLVGRLGDSVVATCMLTIVPNLTRRGRSYSVIENVVTRADHRGQGLGRALLATAVERAWAADCYKVCLSTGRPETVAFYEACGFAANTKDFLEIRRP
ncbi:GNAT family N-acetyltransferase [Phenylobacterium immobile]|uniref:GNAT family N-acetyltransferase n=1 Tax=Phenylobacterium immobile TaxID=21 RepID=UPI000AE5329A|nr:GNAT family N-acetyltransferase [Phenylobacterium immobile]